MAARGGKKGQRDSTSSSRSSFSILYSCYLFLFISIILISNTAIVVQAAETIVDQAITKNTTWDLGGSPYHVTRNVILNENVTLTIMPGVIVRLESERSLYLAGTIIARGTPDQKIIFTSVDVPLTPDGRYINPTIPPVPSSNIRNYWGGIFFTPSSPRGLVNETNGDYTSGSIIEHCRFEFGGEGTNTLFWDTAEGLLYLKESYPIIRDVQVYYSKSNALYLTEIQTWRKFPFVLERCEFRNSTKYGAYILQLGTGAGDVSFRRCTVSGNKEGGISGLMDQDLTYFEVLDSVIQWNMYSGIRLSGAGVVDILRNVITNNMGGELGDWQSQTNYAAVSFWNVARYRVSDNIINENKGGAIDVQLYYPLKYILPNDTRLDLTNRISNNEMTRNYGGGDFGGLQISFGLSQVDDDRWVADLLNPIGLSPVMVDNNSFIQNYQRYGADPIVTVSAADCEKAVAVYSKKGGPGFSLNGKSVDDYCSTFLEFSNNKFFNNSVARGAIVQIEKDTKAYIHNNTFEDQISSATAKELAYLNGVTGGPLSAPFNWWGTADPVAIRSRVRDFITDDSCGLVDYLPYLTARGFSGPVSSVSADDVLGGQSQLIKDDTRWTISMSPIMLNKSVYLRQGTTLTIDPGVRVLFTGTRMVLDGKLIAQGTQANPILFTSADSSYWKQIVFSPLSPLGSILSYCEISQGGANTKNQDQGDAMIRAEGNAPAISDSKIIGSSSTGLWLINVNTYASIQRTQFSQNLFGAIRTAEIVNLTLTDNLIADNGDSAVTLSFYWAAKRNDYTSTQLIVRGNHILRNNGTGLYTEYPRIATFINNTIEDNKLLPSQSHYSNWLIFSSLKAGGLEVDTPGVTTITDNIIRNNVGKAGGGLRFEDAWGAPVTIARNVISGNQATTNYPALFVTPAGPTVVSDNVITNNGDLSTYNGAAPDWPAAIYLAASAGINLTFTRNQVVNNSVTAGPKNATIVVSGPVVVQRNVISNPMNGFELANKNSILGSGVTATFNWWGAADPHYISGRLYDFLYDDTLSLIDFSPFYTSSALTPDSLQEWTNTDFDQYPVISGSLTWTNQVSLTRTVLILPTGVLTISPGSVIRLAPGKSIICAGTIIASGTPSQPIRFTSMATPLRRHLDNTTAWQSLVLTTQSRNSVFTNCIFDHGGLSSAMVSVKLSTNGLLMGFVDCNFTESNTDGVSIEEVYDSPTATPFTMTGCNVLRNARVGLVLTMSSVVTPPFPTISLSKNNFQDNLRGIRIYTGRPNANIRILQNDISYNTEFGIYSDRFSGYGANVLISGNTFIENGLPSYGKLALAGALALSNVDASMFLSIQSNQFLRNSGGTSSSAHGVGYAAAIAIDMGTAYQAPGLVRVANNYIADNRASNQIIYIDDWFTPDVLLIENNLITNNVIDKQPIIYFETKTSSMFRNNTITANKVLTCPKYTLSVANGVNSRYPVFRNNLFSNPYNQYELAVRIPLSSSVTPLDVRYNWWGTAARGAITDRIRDYLVDDSIVSANWYPGLSQAPSSCLTCPPQGNAPRLVYAGLLDSGAGFLARFDRPTDRGHVFRTVPCDQIFFPQPSSTLEYLGDDASCSWVDDVTLLAIYGPSATILPGNSIHLRPGIITSLETGVKNLNDSIDICPPDIPVVPVSVIIAPKTINQFETLLLDGTASYGSGGRALRYKWDLKGSYPVIDNFLATQKNSTVSLPATLFASYPAPKTYVFTLVTRNYLNEWSDEVSVSVTYVVEPIPTIFIDGAENRTSVRRNSIVLRGGAQLPATNNSGGSGYNKDYYLEFRWKEASGQLQLDKEPGVTGIDTRQLFLPPFFLEFNVTYVFELIGYLISNHTGQLVASSVALTRVYVEEEPTIAIVTGGDRDAFVGYTLVVNGSNSYDPNLETPYWQGGDPLSVSNGAGSKKSPGQYRYAWSCRNARTQAKCFDDSSPAPIGMTSSALIIPPHLLPADQYIFTLRFMSTRPNDAYVYSSASVTITLKSSPIPLVSISVLSSSLASPLSYTGSYWKINAYQRLILWGSVNRTNGDQANLTHTWTVLEGDADLSDSKICSTGINYPSLVLLPGALVIGQIYRFQLAVQDLETFATGKAEIVLQASIGPVGGNFTVTPNSGVALTTPFSLSCTTWADNPKVLPLSYSFAYQLKGSDYEVSLSDIISTPTFTAYLPFVYENNTTQQQPQQQQQTLTLIAYIWNAQNDNTRVTFEVTLLPSTSQATIEGIQQQAQQTLDADTLLHLSDGLARTYDATTTTTTTTDQKVDLYNYLTQQLAPRLAVPTRNRADQVLNVMSRLLRSSSDNQRILKNIEDKQNAASFIRKTLRSPATVLLPNTHTQAIRALSGVMDNPSDDTFQADTFDNRTVVRDYISEVVSFVATNQAVTRSPDERPLDIDSTNIRMRIQKRRRTTLPLQPLGIEPLTPGQATPSVLLSESVSDALEAAGLPYVSVLVASYGDHPLYSSPALGVRSNVTVVSLYGGGSGADKLAGNPLRKPIILSMPILPGFPLTDLECQFYNVSEKRFSSAGCTLQSVDKTSRMAACACNHLTDFGVLARPQNSDGDDGSSSVDTQTIVAIVVPVVVGVVCFIGLAVCAVVTAISVTKRVRLRRKFKNTYHRMQVAVDSNETVMTSSSMDEEENSEGGATERSSTFRAWELQALKRSINNNMKKKKKKKNKRMGVEGERPNPIGRQKGVDNSPHSTSDEAPLLLNPQTPPSSLNVTPNSSWRAESDSDTSSLSNSWSSTSPSSSVIGGSLQEPLLGRN